MEPTIIDLFLGQSGKCFYCFRPMSFNPGATSSMTRDHFFPKKNGNKKNGNLVLAHAHCNETKGHRDPDESELVRFNALYKKINLRKSEIVEINKYGIK